MKAVTLEEFKKFDPCWLYTGKGQARLEQYGKQRECWTALDVLALKRVSPEERLRVVLREEFLDAPILHEFGCLCGERALSWIENPDPRSVAGIQAKRDWLQGKITREELDAARKDTWAAVYEARVAAWEAAVAAVAAEDAAELAAWAAAEAAGDAARAAEERQWQVDMLIGLLEKADGK